MNKNATNYYEQAIYSSKEPIITYENQILSTTAPTMHYHDVIEIGIVTKGSGTFVINETIHHFNKGNVSVIFPNDIHISSSNIHDTSVWSYVLIDIYRLIKENPHLFASVSNFLYDEKLPSRIFSNRNSRRVVDIILKLFHEQFEKKDGYFEMSTALCAELLIEISRNYPLVSEKIVKHKDDYQKINPAISHIMRFYNEEITIEQLSKICFLSESHFRKIFKQVTGLVPLDYLHQVRISVAKSLLKIKSIPISQICYDVGYHSQTSFNKHFKHYTGTTPSSYMKEKTDNFHTA